MFRSNLEGSGAAADNFSAFHARGGLNILGLQDMYLDTSGANSSATLSPPITPVTPDPSTSAQSTHFPFLADSAATANSLLMQRQYHYHLLLQQQQQLAMAQHQLALAASAAAASASHQQTDEIARSLKIFAQVTTGAAENAAGSMQDVMQEFATNGYASDDLGRMSYGSAPPQVQMPPQQQHQQQQGLHLPLGRNPAQLQTNGGNLMPIPLATHWLNNYREHLNNVWRNMSYIPAAPNTMGLQAQTAATVSTNLGVGMGLGLPVQGEQLRGASNSSNNNNNNNKVYKRYNSKAKEISRHCVFCENNNEPEAVINSHSVRDNFNRVLCPKLRTYVCPICGASGDSAHTIKYCPKKPIITMEDAIKAESFRLAKSSYYKQQMKV
uniref:Nanos, isoform B n=1 Tax=Drosophila melanogaster TaxID=7227 RepID=A0A0B4KGY5_DROME|nr:nanos, isoform B [Drosophila melanogaster]AGB96103.1 nanos, isoform B [Drosophila melanogaster]|eukprot:NP_001262723.1 nanos, isoform B [Drosophila melanogaster]